MAAEPLPQWILWAGTVGFNTSLADRFAAATATGCRRVSLSPPDVLRSEAAGVSAADIGARARELGLELIVDPVMNWYPHAPATRSRFGAVSTDEALRICAELGAVGLTVISVPDGDPAIGELGARLADVCDRAAGFGAQVQLEFLPFTVVGTLRTAWDIVQAADRDNAGIVFDTWHFYRGDPDFAVLDAVPGERIFAVQLDDAPAVAEADLYAETRRRLLPGDGALDLVRAVQALHRIGGLRWVGPEVLSPELEDMPVAASWALAMRRTRELVDTALAGA